MSPSKAAQPEQHSHHHTATTTQPSSLEWGPAAEGVALKIFGEEHLVEISVIRLLESTKIQKYGRNGCWGKLTQIAI